jgi:hypothetical protein
MDNTEEKQELTPEEQLAQLATKQRKLEQDIAEAKAAKAQKQMQVMSAAATARKEAEAQERLVLEEIKARRLQREKEAQEEQDRAAEENRKLTEARNAQQAAEKAARLKAEAVAEQLREEYQKASALEMELQRQILGLDDKPVVMVEAEPTTLAVLPGPLARLFTADVVREQSAGYQGLSSEQHNNNQRKIDAIENIKEFGPSKVVAPADMPAPAPEPVAKKTRRKPKHFVDISMSREIEALIRKELKMNPNTEKCDLLSANWEDIAVISAVREVIEVAKTHSMSHDSFFALVEQLLEGNEKALNA